MRIVLVLFLCFVFHVPFFGQETSAKPLIAPGGLTVIPPNIDYESVALRADLTDLLPRLHRDLDPALQTEAPFIPEKWAQNIRYNRDVWCLQFSFKPLRIIDVDIPNAKGQYDKKKVWYLVYNVKNLGPAEVGENKIEQINSVLSSEVPEGKELNLPVQEDETSLSDKRHAPLPIRQDSGYFAASPGKTESIRFVPQFVLATQRLVLGTTEKLQDSGKIKQQAETKAVAYTDRIIPLALNAVVKREGMKAEPETTLTFPQKELSIGQDLWGVAMWTDVDPRIHEFSIYVTGLTNAYKRKDAPPENNEVSDKIAEGRILQRRVLKIDWWRVGDEKTLSENQIHFGAKDAVMSISIFSLQGDANQDGVVDAEERKEFNKISEAADRKNSNGESNGWVDALEKIDFYRVRQHWMQPSYGYQWLFL